MFSLKVNYGCCCGLLNYTCVCWFSRRRVTAVVLTCHAAVVLTGGAAVVLSGEPVDRRADEAVLACVCNTN